MDKINFTNLPNQTTPVNANNLNLMQTNIENAINGVVETVSNKNGYAIKFANGTMICYATVPPTSDIITADEIATTVQGIKIYRSNVFRWYYPASFIATPTPTVSAEIRTGTSGSRICWSRINYPGTESVQLQFLGVEPFTETGLGYTNILGISLIAIGRWK